MIKSVVARTPILVFILLFLALGYTIAHNKVVVVPLGGAEPNLDIYYGSVRDDGTLAAGNLPTVIRNSQPSYTIELGRSPIECVPVVTRGRNLGGTVITSGISIADVGNGITVRHIDQAQQSVESPFHILITCPRA